jgi:integrase
VKRAHIIQYRKRGTWYVRWYENGDRKQKRLGTIRWPTREEAEQGNRHQLSLYNKPSNREVPTVAELIQQFSEEKMSKRFSMGRSNEAWIRNHILPKWGDSQITDLQARPVEFWLRGLALAPKSLVHTRGLVRQLWDFAMWTGSIETQRNPMQLVTVKGATKRKKPRSLTEDEFRKFVANLDEPIRTLALLCVSFGLRISEVLALRWSDVDWLQGTLEISRGIVMQHVGDVKTTESARNMAIDRELLAVLKSWKQTSQFASEGDWLFASPVKIGRQPISYPHVWQTFQEAAREAGIPQFGTHTLRHTYRSWLDAVGAPIAVQQKLMRHTDIRTTMNVYGDVVTDEMRQAHSKVVRMALRDLN